MVKQIRRDQETGMYEIKGTFYPDLVGSRAQVFHGTAYKTAGDLTKDNLIQNKWGRIVSKAKYDFEKGYKRLKKHGYTAKKGKFGAVKTRKARKNKTKKSKK